ncbi:MAG TPA: protein kinase [Polyangiaceae bacterium]|nr:protein kinase [Polyangiaceae bacterium]
METQTDLPTTPGTVIAGKYRVLGVIGEGGMGAIIKARHLSLNRDVAIKLMRSEITGVHKASERFVREARATANIESEYIARVSDIDVLPSGIPFIVMEYLDGVDLATHVTDARQRGVTEAVDWMLQALAGLAAAHKLGIVHRDLKPTNLFVIKRPDDTLRVKVLDFGVSKVLDDSDFSREGNNDGLTTQGNFVVGTPRYMAPEQITAPKEVDERADLWAIGLILYEFLAGAHPFDGKTPGAIMANVISAPILPIDSFRTDVPLELARVVERCLQRDRELRFESAHELMRALAPYGSPKLAAKLLAELPAEVPRAARAVLPALGAPAVAVSGAPFAAVQPAKAMHGSSSPQQPGAALHTAVQRPANPRDAATVHTPSGAVPGSIAIPISVERPAAATLASADGTPVSNNVAAGKPPSSGPADSKPSSSGDPGTLLEWDRERSRERPRRTLLMVTAISLVTGALVGGGWFFSQRMQSSAAAPEATALPVRPVAPSEVIQKDTLPAAPAAAPAEPTVAPEVAPTASAVPGDAPHQPKVIPAPPTQPAPAPATAPAPAPHAPVTKKAVSSAKKPAKNASATPSNKNSILGTRN